MDIKNSATGLDKSYAYGKSFDHYMESRETIMAPRNKCFSNIIDRFLKFSVSRGLHLVGKSAA
jgi:hypothetical protein